MHTARKEISFAQETVRVLQYEQVVVKRYTVSLDSPSVPLNVFLLQRPTIAGLTWFNSHPCLVVASLDKTLYDNYLCLMESSKQEIEEVRSKIQAENVKTRSTPKSGCLGSSYVYRLCRFLVTGG